MSRQDLQRLVVFILPGAMLFWGAILPSPECDARQIPQFVELVRADSMVHYQVAGREITRIMGRVIFRKGRKELRCDLATYYHDDESIIFQGHVEFEDSSRFLRADEIHYYAEPEQEIARGDAFLRVDQKEITAREMRYLVAEDSVIARKNVQFEDFKNNVQLFGGYITYDRDREVGHARIQPRLVKLDSLGKVNLTIEAKVLNYNGQEHFADARDSVVITQHDAVVYARKAEYYDDQDKVEITGNPIVYQKSDRLSAEKIELYLEKHRLRKAHLVGNSKMISQFMLEGKIASDRLTGKEMWVDIVNDSLKQIHVLQQASSMYHVIERDEVQGVNQVMGDEIKIIFENGKVRYVTITSKPGLSRGQFTPAGKPVPVIKWSQ